MFVVLLLNNTQYLQVLSVLDSMVPENIHAVHLQLHILQGGSGLFKHFCSQNFFIGAEGGQFVIWLYKLFFS